MNELVYIEKHDTGVAEIVLNNPARKNAMGAPMMRELCAAVLEVQDDDEVRAVASASLWRAIWSMPPMRRSSPPTSST